MRLRAVVLAAGHGERLRPLSGFRPKPLFPVAGRSVIGHTLSQLAAAGCEAAAVNLHHLGDQIREHLGDAWGGMPLTYSPEEEIQGTLGALVPLRGFLRGADLVLVVNGDSFCQWPLQWLVRRHGGGGAAATLLLSKQADCAEFGGGVGIDDEGRVVSLRPGRSFGEARRRRVFAGAHAFSPELLEALEPGPADFVEHLYEPLLERGVALRGLTTSRPWHDLGTPVRYLAAALAGARGWPGLLRRGSWVAAGAQVDPEARIRGAAIEAGARVEAGALLVRSVVLPGAVVGERCEVRSSIVGFDAELPSDTAVEGHVVSPVRPDSAPRETDSVMGGLVYSPL